MADYPQENRRAGMEGPPGAQVREDDLEPHAGLRYVARLFKLLAVLLVLLLIAEVVVGIMQEGAASIAMLLIEATRIVVFAGFLWGAGDFALMFIESNHDLRATRILMGRMNATLERTAPGGGPGGGVARPFGGPPDGAPPQVP